MILRKTLPNNESTVSAGGTGNVFEERVTVNDFDGTGNEELLSNENKGQCIVTKVWRTLLGENMMALDCMRRGFRLVALHGRQQGTPAVDITQTLTAVRLGSLPVCLCVRTCVFVMLCSGIVVLYIVLSVGHASLLLTRTHTKHPQHIHNACTIIHYCMHTMTYTQPHSCFPRMSSSICFAGARF